MDKPRNASVRAVPRWLRESVALTRQGDLEGASDRLRNVSRIADELPRDLLLAYLYDAACLASLKSEDAGGPQLRDDLLAASLDYLTRWLHEVLASDALGKQHAYNAIFRMARDSDLHGLLSARRDDVLGRIPVSLKMAVPPYAPVKQPPGKGGCLPTGALVRTPSGDIKIESISEGDNVLSVNLVGRPSLLRTQVLQVHALRVAECVEVNEGHIVSGTQPVATEDGKFVRVDALEPSQRLLTGDLGYLTVANISHKHGRFEVYHLTTDHESHNFIANGLVCHNGKLSSG